MHRLSNGTQSNTLPTPQDVIGTPGFPVSAAPGGAQQASVIDPYQALAIQEEVSGIVEGFGGVLDKTNNNQAFGVLKAIGSRTLSWTTPGTYTWTCPPGVYWPWARVVGGGGGGCDCIGSGDPASSNSGSGGGAGGYAEGMVAVMPGNTYTIVVGTGGTAQVTGGTSSALGLSATGGGGASFTGGGVSPGGVPGVGANGNILTCSGGYGSDGQSGTYRFAGNGAPGPFGGGGRAGDGGGANGTAPGAGGGGAYDSTNSSTLKMGGLGAPGAVMLVY